MSILILLIIISLLLAIGFLVAFLWAVKSGQYDDDYTPSVRILFENTQKQADEILNPEIMTAVIETEKNK